MANVLNNLFGGAKPATPDPVKGGDSDFADFKDGADPSPIPFTPVSNTLTGAQPAQTLRPYTKWYRLDERHSLSDFKGEGIILAVISVFLLFHLIGAGRNRAKAKKWICANSAPIASEFASVGFDGVPHADSSSKLEDANILREKSLFEFATYATGRANVAFVDVKLTLIKRFNPLTSIFEAVLGFFWDSFPSPKDVFEATTYPFDGRETQIVPGAPGAAELQTKDKSGYDNFVWALVHKDQMKKLRDDRYDLSLTSTKDHPKLPIWLTVMSESAEITDLLLTPELIEAAKAAGDAFEYLIVSDQPIDQPKTLDETVPRKRIFLRYSLPSDNDYTNLVPIFHYFLRISDQLAKSAHFRPEVVKKVKIAREAVIKRIQKAEEEEKAEERALEKEKARKAKRDAELNALDAKGQKKYLEKERERELKKGTKKMTTRA